MADLHDEVCVAAADEMVDVGAVAYEEPNDVAEAPALTCS